MAGLVSPRRSKGSKRLFIPRETIRAACCIGPNLKLNIETELPMTSIAKLLGDKAEYLLNFKNPKIPKEKLHLPGPDMVDRIYAVSDRNNRVLCNLQRIFNHGRRDGPRVILIITDGEASAELAG